MFDPDYLWLISIVSLIIFLVLWFIPEKKREPPENLHISEPVATLVKRLQEGKASLKEEEWKGHAYGLPVYYTNSPLFIVYKIKDRDVGLSVYIEKFRSDIPSYLSYQDTYPRDEVEGFLSERSDLTTKIEESQFWLSSDEKIYLRRVCEEICNKERQKEIEVELARAIKNSRENEERLRVLVESERNSLINKYKNLTPDK